MARVAGGAGRRELIYLVPLVIGLAASLFDTRSLAQNPGREWITLWLPIALLAARQSSTASARPSSRSGPSSE